MDFVGPGPDFGRFWERFFQILDRFWIRFFEVVASQTNCQECQESQERQERLPKQELDHKCAKRRWAAVLPPRGGSIK